MFPPQNSSPSTQTALVHETLSVSRVDLSIKLLGSYRCDGPEEGIPDLPGTRNALLLAYFAQSPGQKIRRDKLLALFWPDVPQESARNSLNVALCHIRTHFQQFLRPEEKIIVHQRGSYLLNPDWIIHTDVQEFTQWMQRGRTADQEQNRTAGIQAYGKALQCYRGDFLEAFPGEDWVLALRDQLRDRYLHALDRLGHLYLSMADSRQALFAFQEMVRCDPFSEKAHRSLMSCYAKEGQTSLAIRQFRKCENMLREEFGVAPSEKTLELCQQIIADAGAPRVSLHRA